MSSNIAFSGVKSKLTPLISFNTLVDTDVGLVQLIKNEYLNQTIFDKSFFDQPFLQIISDLYYRKDINPLLLFAKNKQNEDLEDYLSEFSTYKKDQILSLSVTTEFINLVRLFNNSSEIYPIILCYNEEQRIILNDDEILGKNKKVLLSELKEKDKQMFTQFYFKYIEEAEPFSHLVGKTFYFSNCGLNLNDNDSDIRESDIIKTIIKGAKNQISLFDLYNKEKIGKRQI